ncbi:MAG: hypothetical protein IT582_11435 [Opitutaceae bacterium]|nr:hypothetical protein [Opitutaceae bacterium]
MSLINNALKKAQRERAANSAEPSLSGAAPLHRGSSGLPKQTLALILAGGAVLIVLSVVATVYLLRADKSPTPNSAEPVATPPTAAITNAPPPAISLPVIQAPVPDAAPVPVTSAISDPAPVPPAPHPIPPVPVNADERVYAFIDNLQIMGVRSSGADSKVLMNDRVYRVNDVVDRALNVRLIRVEPNRLVFEDAGGATYTKTF